MDFARRIMEKYGWSEGKGLGQDGGGITEALKPKMKFDTAGLNYSKAEEFTFHWWDHMYNKAATNITVHKDKDGAVQISRSSELEVSTKRPSKAKRNAGGYSGFIKGKSLLGDHEEEAGQMGTTDDSEEEEEEKDRSLKLTDAQLFQMCEGRTAHKGARHGLNMTAKLARVQKQEQRLMAAWNRGVENQVKKEKMEPEGDLVKSKKKKKKKRGSETIEDNDENKLVAQEDMQRKRKKRKKMHQHEKKEENILQSNEAQMVNTEGSLKVKNKKKRKRETMDISEESVGSRSNGNCSIEKIRKSDWKSNDIDGEEVICIGMCTTKKKKKKDKKGVNEYENCVAISVEHNIVKKDKESCQIDKDDVCDNTTEEFAIDREKKSKRKRGRDLSMTVVSDECIHEYKRKKKKKKSKDRIEGLF